MGATRSTLSTWKDRKRHRATAAQFAEWQEQYQRHFEYFNRQYFAIPYYAPRSAHRPWGVCRNEQIYSRLLRQETAPNFVGGFSLPQRGRHPPARNGSCGDQRAPRPALPPGNDSPGRPGRSARPDQPRYVCDEWGVATCLIG